jgi:hypothetical protein
VSLWLYMIDTNLAGFIYERREEHANSVLSIIAGMQFFDFTLQSLEK